MSTPRDRLESPPWHDDLWAAMRQAIATDRVAHGLLVTGAAGVGKRHFVQRVIAALLCNRRDAYGDACGECTGCRLRRAETHPDVSRLVPEEGGKLIKVDQVRAFCARLQLTPQYDSGRIGRIDPAEALSPSAANSLLKTLEEPPAGCHILLVADRPSALMATIRSRCQTWRIPPAKADVARDWLASQGVDAEALTPDALRVPFSVMARREREETSSVESWDTILDRVIRRREDVSTAAEQLHKVPRDLLLDWLYSRASALLEQALSPPGDEAAALLSPRLAEIAARIDPAVFAPWTRRVADTARLAHTNAEWRLVIESLLLSLRHCLKRRAA